MTQTSYGRPHEGGAESSHGVLLLKDPQVPLSLCFSSGNLPTPWNRIAWSSVKRRDPPEAGLQVRAAECDCAGDCVGLAHSADAQTTESAFPRLGLTQVFPGPPPPVLYSRFALDTCFMYCI